MTIKEIKIETQLKQSLSAEQAWHYHIVPKASENGTLVFYADNDKKDINLIAELELLFGKTIQLDYIGSDLLLKTLSKYYRRADQESKQQIQHLGSIESDDFILDLINEANEVNASDIHLEPFEEKCRVRLRIDGKLIERYIIKKEDYPAIVNKIKIKANLDIAEKRLPQDGRIFFDTGSTKFDIRISVLPTLHGEKIVLRLLSQKSTGLDIELLGFSEKQLGVYLEGIKKTSGIVIISGPTGSGKTTTLYSTLRIINKEDVNILTIEDPIEYTLEGVNQVQLKESIGLTFAAALRTFLRQDPDVIMLGEIRDKETAQMAIRASLTGHLVLSTVHTNSAWGAVSRLIDMGIPPFLISGTLNLALGQRLVRLLCPECKKEVGFEENQLPENFKPESKPGSIFESEGCPACYYTGFKGRKAVYEVISIDHILQERIKLGELNVAEILRERGIKTMADQAFDLISSGQTTIEEVYPILLNQEY